MTPDLAWWGRLAAFLVAQTALVAVAAALVNYKIRAPQARRAVWQAALIAMACVWLGEAAGLGEKVRALWPREQIRIVQPTGQFITITTEATGSTPMVAPRPVQLAKPAAPVTWPGKIWLLGTLILLLRAGVIRVWLAWQRGKMPLADMETLGLLERLRTMLRLKRAEARTWARLRGPVAFGWWRPTVAVPVDFSARFTSGQRAAMLSHEMAHLAACDPAWLGLTDIIRAVAWWNPLVWWGAAQLRSASEIAADEASALVPDGPSALAESLLHFGRDLAASGSLRGLGVAGKGFRSSLGRRVKALLGHPGEWRELPGAWRWSPRIVAAIFVVALTSLPVISGPSGSVFGLLVSSARAESASQKENPQSDPHTVSPLGKVAAEAAAGLQNSMGLNAPATNQPQANAQPTPAVQNGGVIIKLNEDGSLRTNDSAPIQYVYDSRFSNYFGAAGAEVVDSAFAKLNHSQDAADASGVGDSAVSTNKPAEVAAENALVVTIQKTGNLFLGNNAVTLDVLTEKLKEAVRENHRTALMIRADAQATFDQVRKVLDAAQAADIHEINLTNDFSAKRGNSNQSNPSITNLQALENTEARSDSSLAGISNLSGMALAKLFAGNDSPSIQLSGGTNSGGMDASVVALSNVDYAVVWRNSNSPPIPMTTYTELNKVAQKVNEGGGTIGRLTFLLSNNPSPGPAQLQAAVIQPDGTILIGGTFTPVAFATPVVMEVKVAEILEGSRAQTAADKLFAELTPDETAGPDALAKFLREAKISRTENIQAVYRLTSNQGVALTQDQFKAALDSMQQGQDCDLLTAPKVTTLPARQAVVGVEDVISLVTGADFKISPKAEVSYTTEGLKTGFTTRLLATPSADGWNLSVMSREVSFVGYDKPGKDQQGKFETASHAVLTYQTPLPRLRIEEIQGGGTVQAGGALMLRGPAFTETSQVKTTTLGIFHGTRTESVKKRLYLFITVEPETK